MVKLSRYFILMGISVLAAGLFGAIHNQISYTIGPSYFHDLKFEQFGVDPTLPPRQGVAMVGWQASWWMGPVLGFIPLTLGLVISPDAASFWRSGLRAISVVIFGTALASLSGLIFGYLTIDENVTRTISQAGAFPADTGFLRAGTMHDFTYLGGVFSIISATWAVWRGRRSTA
ncbi:MAG: hypothetical protein ACU0BB_13210 [Paracoccaceae bacterium]